MNKIFKNKKIILVLCFGLLVFNFLFSFDFTSAQEFAAPKLPTGPDLLPRGTGAVGATGVGLGAAAKGIGAAAGLSILKTGAWAVSILGFLVLLQHALWWFIGFGYSLLNSAVNVALDPNWFQIDAVLQGWQLVRDFVNVWFILVFLIIAIGTILRATNFQAKKLLPTMILVALVVNFSMPVSKFVIDVSNIISFQFLKAICPEVKNETGAQYCDFAGNLENGLDAKGFTQTIKETIEAVPAEEATPKENPKFPFNSGNELIPKAHAFAFVPILVIAAKWIGPAIAFWAFESIASYFTNTSFGGVSVGAFVSALTTNIFLLFTAFVILAIALLFLIRIISLIFLVVVSPFGFAAMILPATQKYASDWWNYLFKQSFFAPFVLFFLWMSLNLINNMKSAFTINGVPYDFTNPANARLMFYIFSILLLYASLWIARKMGAIGAETIIKWGNTARSAITGFVGGLAARNLWAPLGAAGIAKGVPETLAKIPLVGPLAGITAAEALRKIAKAGKAPEEAAAKAELGMRLSPADRGAYFAKLDRAAKEAMLRKMKGEERNSFISDLATKDLTSAQEARAILRTAAFAPEERAKTELDELKYSYTLPEQWKKFGSLSADLQKQFLLGIEDAEKRAQFLNQVKTEAEKNGDTTGLTAFQNANTFLETSSAFSANQQYANILARYKTEHVEKQKLNEFASFFENITNEKEQKTRFKFATNELQKLELFEAYKDKPELLKKLQGWVNEMDPADQDKLYRDYVGKRASSETVVAFIRAVNTGKPERDKAIKKMILSGASAAQLGVLYRDNKDDPELLSTIDEYVITMTEQNKKVFEKNRDRSGGGGGTPDAGSRGAGPTGGAPTSGAPTAAQFVRTNNPTDIVAYLNTFDPEKDETVFNQAVAEIKSKPQEQQIEILRTLNPIIKIRYIDNISFTKEEEFITKLSQDIKKTERIDFKDQVFENPSMVSDSRFQQAFLRGGNIPKLLSLIREQPNAVKFIRDAVTKNMPTQDSELHAKAIEEKFGIEFRNHELAVVLSDIRRAKKETLNQTGKELKELFFE